MRKINSRLFKISLGLVLASVLLIGNSGPIQNWRLFWSTCVVILPILLGLLEQGSIILP